MSKGYRLVQLRVGSLNIETMIGRGREVADLMERRIEFLCVQETRWKGNKSREVGGGCKLVYSGANRQDRNGVGIVLRKETKDSAVAVGRRSDRVMSVKLRSEETVNIACAYAPKVGCEEEEKAAFWEQLDLELSLIPAAERAFLGSNLNGHI